MASSRIPRRLLFCLSAAAALGRSRPSRAADAAPQAATRAGRVAGELSDGVRVFRGIPFAAPPVGALRFRPPVPPRRWAGVRPAHAFAAAPVQPEAGYLAGVGTSEDCLYLNVWAPAQGADLPVFVWFYGGGNVSGATSQPVFDGATFARDGVVCVTVAYREGAFGFLELGALLGADYSDSGNAGLQDQVQALRWVQDNIAAFGGDRARVTIAGESAGAKDICGLLAAPAAAGLFRRAIVESGSGHTVFSRAEAERVAELTLAAAELAPGEAAALRDLPAARLLAAEQAVIRAPGRKFPFRPVVDGSFLPSRPVDAVAAGASRGVALLAGSNRDESVLFLTRPVAARALAQSELGNLDAAAFAALEDGYARVLPDLSGPERRWRMVTAEEYWVPTLRVAEGHVAAGGEAWLYRFDRAAQSGPFAGRAVHASELPYVWDNSLGRSGYDARLMAAMHAAWVAFVRDGKPAAEGLPDWPRFDLATHPTMILDDKPRLESDPRGAERRLWEGVL